MRKENLLDRQNGIDLMKFICSFLVVMIHIAPFGSDEKYAYLNYGIQHYLARIAVPFFFCASGFFLFKKIKQDASDINVILQYVKKIIRLYIIWSIIYLPLNIYTLTKSEDITHSLFVLGRNTVFAGSYMHLWYLTATAFAVLLIGFLLFKKVTLRKIFVIALFFYFVGLLGESYFGVLKLLKPFTHVWNGLKIIEKVIVGTRNGLFFGFLFITMGAVLSHKDNKITIKNSFFGFCVSMLFMLVEAIMVKYFDFVLDTPDMYICLIPVVYFMFRLIQNIKLKNSEIWIKLRHMSSLIFFTHMWVASIIKLIFRVVFDYVIDGKSLHFILTYLGSVLVAYIIVKLSDNDNFKWLKKGYL